MCGVGALCLPCCFAHGFEDAKGLSTCMGEPVRPGDLEQQQSLQFKFAIDMFLRFILCQRTHSVSRGLTVRKLLQNQEMCFSYDTKLRSYLQCKDEGIRSWNG